MKKFVKWIPTAITIALTVAGACIPAIQPLIKNDTQATVIVTGVYALAKGLLASPLEKKL